jgi:hypothetical protein
LKRNLSEKIQPAPARESREKRKKHLFLFFLSFGFAWRRGQTFRAALRPRIVQY